METIKGDSVTKEKLKEAVDKLSYSNYGLFLGFFINSVLKRADLTALQDSALEAAYKADGEYKPQTFDTLYKSCLEILGMISDGKIESAITLLKRCPVPEQGNRLTYYINGKKCSKSAYFNGDKIKGKRSIKGYDTPIDVWELLSLDSFKATGFCGTRGGEEIGIKLFGDDFKESDTFPEPKPDVIIVPTPKSEEPSTFPESYEEDELGDNIASEDYDEFGEPDEPSEWQNR